ARYAQSDIRKLQLVEAVMQKCLVIAESLCLAVGERDLYQPDMLAHVESLSKGDLRRLAGVGLRLADEDVFPADVTIGPVGQVPGKGGGPGQHSQLQRLALQAGK